MSRLKDREVHGAEIMELVPHGPSDNGFEPVTFDAQVQYSTVWATGDPQGSKSCHESAREWKELDAFRRTHIFLRLC